MQHEQRAWLQDIIQSIEAIDEYVNGYDEDSFLGDRRTQDAVLRRLLVIGEAAGRLTPDTVVHFSGIPFYKIVGMRNRVVHDYGHIDLQIVWEIIRVHLPPVKQQLNEWLERIDEMIF